MLSSRDSAQLLDACGPKTVRGSSYVLRDILEDRGVPVSPDLGETYWRKNMPHTLQATFCCFPILPKPVLENCPSVRGYTDYTSAGTGPKEVLVLLARCQLPSPVPDQLVP